MEEIEMIEKTKIKLKDTASYKATLQKMNWKDADSCVKFIKKFGREAFYYAMSIINPQQSHNALENLFIKSEHGKRLSVLDNKGDYVNDRGQNIERKSSFTTKENDLEKTFNIVQIRPFHNIDLYNILLVEFFPEIVETICEIPSANFYELVEPSWSPAHISGNVIHSGGRLTTDKAKELNVEMRVSFGKTGRDGRIWRALQKYKVVPR